MATQKYGDGSVYEGDLVDGKRQGYAVMKHANGTFTEGYYYNDKQEGNGIWHMADGRMVYTSWLNNVCHGVGQIHTPGKRDIPKDIMYVNGKSQNVPTNHYDSKNVLKNSAYDGGFRIYHRGMCAFILETPSATIFFDWNQGIIPKIREDKPVYALFSHVHLDHFSAESVAALLKLPSIEKIIIGSDETGPDAALVTDAINRIRTLVSPADMDDIIVAKYSQRGISFNYSGLNIYYLMATDLGLAYCVQIDGKTFYHSGDLANWGQTDLFERFISDLRGLSIDYAMITADCFDGTNKGLITLDKYNSVAKIKCFTPCHFWLDYKAGYKMLTRSPALMKKAIAPGLDTTVAVGNLPLFGFYKLPIDGSKARFDKAPLNFYQK